MYDFTTIWDRQGTEALAVDCVGRSPGFAPNAPKEGFSFIPMWVADMNFATVPGVTKALIERAQHPLYGYLLGHSKAYFDTIMYWQRTRHGVTELTPANIYYENGVLGGVASAMNIFCSKGDKVLMFAPTYSGFTGCLRNNGYQIVLSQLVLDEKNVWRIDFADVEEKLAKQHIHATVFCSPHNPAGRVWERWELEQLMELCRKYDVMVVSDEIWSDLALPGYTHIPTQMVSEDAKMRTVALYSPAKTFNLAGLVGSYHIVYNPYLQDRMKKEASLSDYNHMNPLSKYSLMAAYTPEGHAWLDELLVVLQENAKYACDFMEAKLPSVHAARPQGTYMLFLDCTEWCAAHQTSLDDLLQKGWDVGVGWQDGRGFNGPCHIRMNLALPLSQVQEAFERLEQYVF